MATDLSSLMSVAPLNASFMIGQNNAQDQQTTALKQLELQQLMQQKAAQESRLQGREPAELEKMLLANQSTAAQIPGQQAQSRSLGVKANVDEATQSSSIDSGNFKNNNDMITKVGQQLSAFVGDLDGVPDIEKPSRIRQAISQLGLPQGAGDRLWQRIGNLPPSQMAAKIKEISEAMLRATPAYAQQMDSTNMTNDMHVVTNAATNASHERVAALNESGRVARADAAKKSIDQQIAAAKTPIEKAEKAEAAYMMFKDSDPDKAAEYLSVYQQARARAAEDAKNRGLAQPRLDIPATNASGAPVNNPSPASEVPAAGTNPLAPASGPQASQPDIGKLVAQQGERYQPDKFEYRMGPNGKIQKRVK